ncbi:11416_t:CDS:1, partial [Gigaspora margarita]
MVALQTSLLTSKGTLQFLQGKFALEEGPSVPHNHLKLFNPVWLQKDQAIFM